MGACFRTLPTPLMCNACGAVPGAIFDGIVLFAEYDFARRRRLLRAFLGSARGSPLVMCGDVPTRPATTSAPSGVPASVGHFPPQPRRPAQPWTGPGRALIATLVTGFVLVAHARCQAVV